MFKTVNIEPEKLTREFILSRITEEDIFYKYMGIRPRTDGYFVNPFRNDDYPDCKFYRDSRGVLKFNDFAYKWNVDCFNVAMKVYNCNYGEVLHKIAKDFDIYNVQPNLETLNNVTKHIQDKEALNKEIQVQRKDFTKWDIDYWISQGWSKEALELFNVGSLLRAWMVKDGKRIQIYEYNKKDPGFVYYFGMHKIIPQYKLYFPLRNNFRFLQNTNHEIIQGWHQLPEEGETLVITKSFKDVGALWGFGFPAIAPMAETVLIKPEQFEELNNRFFDIYTLFDRDRTGMVASQLYRKSYNTTPLLFDSEGLFRKESEPKDFTDHLKAYGNMYIVDLIEAYKYDT